MIKIKGHKVFFSGKDEKLMRQEAKELGLSVQDTFTGMLWEHLMRVARQGVFKNGKRV